MLKCKPGKEKDIVILLLRKFFDLRDKPGALEILSAFTRDGHNGYIYVEANRQLHVQQAIEKVTGIYAQTIKLVPVNEMVDCLTIKKRDVDLKIGGWVRIKKGRKYDGDLAQILEVGDGAEFIKIKIIPRIEYALTEKRKKSLQRPVQKFFSPDNVLEYLFFNLARNY